MDNMKSTITERGDYWHPDPEKDKKLGGPGPNQRAREDRAAASKPKSDPKKLKKGESYMDYAKRHGYKKSTPKKKSLLSKLLRKEAYRVLAKGDDGKRAQFSYKDEKDAKKFAATFKKATVTKEHHQKDKDGKVIEHGDGTPSSVEEAKKKGLDGKECWDGYKLAGTKKKGGKTVDNCVKTEGVGDAIRAGVKRHKDAVEKKKVKNRKAVPYAALAAQYKPEGQMIEGKGYQPEIEHSKLGDAKKKADKKRESKLPPHLQGDAIAKMKKAFAHTNESVDLTEEWIDSAVEIASDYFFSEGINEEGLDQIIDEVGLEDFVDFVIDPIEELNEERSARKATSKAPSYEKVKAKVDAADAARRKAGKGEYAKTAAAKRNYGDEDNTIHDDKPAKKKKAVAKVTVRKPKAAPKKKAATVKKVEKAVKTAKKTQPAKPTSKKGLLGRVGDAVKKGVERHKKARAAGREPEKRVKEFAKGFKSGVKDTVKFAKKVKKAVSEEQIDELKSTTLLSYSQKAANQLAFKGDGSKKAQKRATGVKRAAGQLTMKAINKEEVELQVDEGIGDMAIKAIQSTNPPYISKRSDMMRKIKLKQLKSYLKKQDDKKKAASKD